MEEVDKIPWLLSLLGAITSVIADAVTYIPQVLQISLTLPQAMPLIIMLNADQFTSPPNALAESHPMKACSLNRPSQISSLNDLPCLLMSVCLVRAWLPHLV